MKALFLSCLVVVLYGCSNPPVYNKTGEYRFEKLGDDCPVTFYSTIPDRKYKELGLVEFYELTFSDAQRVIKPLVCKNGGNGVLIWEANGKGHYLKATVIRID